MSQHKLDPKLTSMEILANVSKLQRSDCQDVSWDEYKQWFETPTRYNANDRSWIVSDSKTHNCSIIFLSFSTTYTGPPSRPFCTCTIHSIKRAQNLASIRRATKIQRVRTGKAITVYLVTFNNVKITTALNLMTSRRMWTLP